MPSNELTWDDHQRWEADWWHDCTNTYGEETKQITYAHRFGLVNESKNGHWPVYDLHNIDVLDIGGGPTSILLKCVNRGVNCTVLDPLAMPGWVKDRYRTAGIGLINKAAETTIINRRYEEAWIYNCLQHVQSPLAILNLAKQAAKTIRVFEWTDHGTSIGHPWSISPEFLRSNLGEGQQELMNENGCEGMAFYGQFSPSTWPR